MPRLAERTRLAVTTRNVQEIGTLDLAERVGVLKADIDSINEIARESLNRKRFNDFGFLIVFDGFRPFAPCCGVLAFDVTRNVTRHR